MTCLSCGSDGESALVSHELRAEICAAVAHPRSRIPPRAVRRLLRVGDAKAQGEIVFAELGLFNRCADCFWWRLALLLGYCAW